MLILLNNIKFNFIVYKCLIIQQTLISQFKRLIYVSINMEYSIIILFIDENQYKIIIIMYFFIKIAFTKQGFFPLDYF